MVRRKRELAPGSEADVSLPELGQFGGHPHTQQKPGEEVMLVILPRSGQKASSEVGHGVSQRKV